MSGAERLRPSAQTAGGCVRGGPEECSVSLGWAASRQAAPLSANAPVTLGDAGRRERDRASDVANVGVITDAKPEAVSFYQGLGFVAVEGVREGLLHGEPPPMFLAIAWAAWAAGLGRRAPKMLCQLGRFLRGSRC